MREAFNKKLSDFVPEEEWDKMDMEKDVIPLYNEYLKSKFAAETKQEELRAKIHRFYDILGSIAGFVQRMLPIFLGLFLVITSVTQIAGLEYFKLIFDPLYILPVGLGLLGITKPVIQLIKKVFKSIESES